MHDEVQPASLQRGGIVAGHSERVIRSHPSRPAKAFSACLFELQQILQDVTGMAAVSLTPMAGAQGEFAGVAMIRAYHRSRGDTARTEIIVPDAAHGTNPATATMCGFTVREIATDRDGNVDLQHTARKRWGRVPPG